MSRLVPTLSSPPERIVSLVPSMTESLFELGLGRGVVGITDYCIHPTDQVVGLPRLGGPKNPRLDEILSLTPDLVVANQEENSPETVKALQEAGIVVWVSFPQTVRQSMEVLWSLADLFHSREATVRLRALETAIDWAESALAERIPWRYFCPIWQDHTEAGKRWWMTFNQHTYAHDLLGLLGGVNVFAERERRYPLAADLSQTMPAEEPGGRDTRYPRVTLGEIQSADPTVILLPDEPYAFDKTHLEEISELFPQTAAVLNGRVHLVEGSLIAWHGTRLARALRELPGILDSLGI
jgi:iron complex transport system substrate-binding protein